jgi:CxxC-x17-CxxC domain-containing protein
MAFKDKTLICSDCNCAFVFTVAEQEMYVQRGYAYAPKRCPDCRQARKTRQAAVDGGSYAGNTSSFGNERYTRRQMFPAVCSDCGKATTVPFEPKLDRPVYCLDCYRKTRAGS